MSDKEAGVDKKIWFKFIRSKNRNDMNNSMDGGNYYEEGDYWGQ